MDEKRADPFRVSFDPGSVVIAYALHMRTLAPLGLAAAALTMLGFAWAGSTAATAPTASTASTALRITVWPEGREGRSMSWTLRCNRTGGSLPRRAQACRLLASTRDPFRPVPPGTVCVGVYGGPAVALVQGSLRGHRIRVAFNRKNGCEIERWTRVRVLFPITVPQPTKAETAVAPA